MQAIIIDDEINAAEVLDQMLLKHCPSIEVVAIFNNSKEAIVYLKENKNVQLIFTDIQMPGINGFELVEMIDTENRFIVFVTAYDRFAIKAFKYNALDYLVKPFLPEELIATVAKAKKQAGNLAPNQLQVLQSLNHANDVQAIALPTTDGYIYLQLTEIIYLEGDGAYTNFIKKDGNKIVVSKNLAAYEELLCDDKTSFFRCHKSYIINLAFVSRYVKGEGGEIIMADKKSIPLSRQKKQEFLERMPKV